MHSIMFDLGNLMMPSNSRLHVVIDEYMGWQAGKKTDVACLAVMQSTNRLTWKVWNKAVNDGLSTWWYGVGSQTN